LKDITIIGAGPTGLFAAFYGVRGASHRLIDNLDQVGGQLRLIPRNTFDVAGFPRSSPGPGQGMAERLQWKTPVHLVRR